MASLSPMSFLSEEMNNLQRNRGWLLALGIVLILLGVLAISMPFVAGVAAAVVLGSFLLVGGILQIIGAFFTRGWGAFFLNLLAGILYVIVGALMLEQPVDALAILTILVAAGLLVSGVFRIVAALADRFPGWGWVLLSGILNVILGLLIWRQWPLSALWVIGLFIGIDLIFSGWIWVALAISLKRFPTAPSVGKLEEPAKFDEKSGIP